MASVIEICNTALYRLGTEPINSLTENSNEAQKCNALYDISRRATLRDFPWSFATKHVALALSTEDPEDYDYAYAIPSDSLLFLNILNVDSKETVDKIPYEIRGSYIYTDEEEAYGTYVCDLTDVNKFDNLFREAVAWRLASDLALALASSVEKHNLAISEYERALYRARGLNARERVAKQSSNPFVAARS